MRRYTKIGLFIALPIIILYLVLPLFFGIATKRYLREFVQYENASLGDTLGMQVTVQDYHQGWFHSRATLLIQKKINGTFQNWKTIPVKITQGPLYQLYGRMTGGLGLLESENTLADAASSYDASFKENIAFNGDQTQYVLLKAKSPQTMPNVPHVQSLLIYGKSDFNADQFQFHAIAKELALTDPAKSFNLHTQELSAQLNAHYLKNQQWHFVTSVNIGENKISFPMHTDPKSLMTIQSDQIQLADLHINTEQVTQLLKQITQLKQQQESNTHQPPSDWIWLAEDALAHMIQDNTQFQIQGLTMTTPYGTVNFHFSLSFPTLPKNHDYFDVAMNSVGDTRLTIPNFQITNDAFYSQFKLSNFTYDGRNNTIFSRNADMAFELFDVDSTDPIKNPTRFSMTGFLYHADANGNTKRFTQQMQWSLNKLCVTNDCSRNIKGTLKFENLNPAAFRSIATAARQLMQYHPTQPSLLMAQWMDIINAYAKLISPQTKITLSNTVTSPQGEVIVQGAVSWPNLSQTQVGMADHLTNQADYQLHVAIPAVYINNLINRAKTDGTTTPPTPSAETTASAQTPASGLDKQIAPWLEYLIQNAYVQQANNAYVLDLKGHGQSFTMNGKEWKTPPTPPTMKQPAPSTPPPSATTAASPPSVAAPASSPETHAATPPSEAFPIVHDEKK